MTSEAIFDFSGGYFDKYLSSLIDKELEEQKSIFELKIVKNENPYSYKITNEGIFSNINGVNYRRFLFMQNYDIKKYGKLPKYHIFNCEVAVKYSSFVLSNTDRVDVIDRYTYELHEDKKLQICSYCANEFKNITSKEIYGKSFMEVILDFEEVRQIKPTDVNSNGYLWNWDEISSAYRATKNYTCEKCGIKMSNTNDYHFMETHHKNFNKTDNKRNNLECLCVLCHSNVDEWHRRNYTNFMQRKKVDKFIEKYRGELRNVGNPYINNPY